VGDERIRRDFVQNQNAKVEKARKNAKNSNYVCPFSDA
jgi:hypothetical protein